MTTIKDSDKLLTPAALQPIQGEMFVFLSVVEHFTFILDPTAEFWRPALFQARVEASCLVEAPPYGCETALGNQGRWVPAVKGSPVRGMACGASKMTPGPKSTRPVM